MIAWWRVRVNEQSYQIGSFSISRALVTTTTAFISSIFLLTLSTFRQLSNRSKELVKAEFLNANPLDIIERREGAISTINRNVGTKGILFIAIIVITIIFASDLSLYANQGILLLLPFAIGAIGSLLLITVLRRKKGVSESSVLFDNTIKCSECGNETALGGNFCEHCGKALLLKKRFEEGIPCQTCKKYNRVGVKHCRYCGQDPKFNPSKNNNILNKTDLNSNTENTDPKETNKL